MDTFTISAAARLCHCDRRTLQRAIHAGRLHLDAQHCLPREELLAAGYLVIDTPQGTPRGVPQEAPQDMPQETPRDTPLRAPHCTPQITPQSPPLAAPLLALLERLASAIADLTREVHQLHAPQALPHGTPQVTPQLQPQEPPPITPHGAPQETPQATPQCHGTYDASAAVARIQTLHRQGLSTRAIAAQLNTEGMPTRRGGAWGGASVGYLLRTHGPG